MAGDTNDVYDVFVHDVLFRETHRVSIDSAGALGNNQSMFPSINADGRFVAFQSDVSNLVTGDTNERTDVFVHDRLTGDTERVSLDSDGLQGNGNSNNPSISSDGRLVAFDSDASYLVQGDGNGDRDVFVHDRQTGETERVSVDSDGGQANNDSWPSSISADGSFVAFDSMASDLVMGDTNGMTDVFVHDRQTEETTRVSIASDGTEGNSLSQTPSISGNGRFVAFRTWATNLVPRDSNGSRDVLVHDRQSGKTAMASVDPIGGLANGESSLPSISADGNYVGFQSVASNLVPDDTNGDQDVFLATNPLLFPLPPVPFCQGLRATIVGTRNADDINGTDWDDVIVALGGNDVIRAGDGNDLVCASPGNDIVIGEGGRDILYGQGGDDRLKGGPGRDRLYGGSGKDFLEGQRGNDKLYGQGDSDRVDGGVGNDIVKGNAGDDVLLGRKGDDKLFGGGDDELKCGPGIYVGKGGPGIDTATGCQTTFGIP